MIGIYLQRGVVRCQRFVDAAGALEGERQIHPGVGMAGHELARPFKLVGGFVELALRKIDDAVELLPPKGDLMWAAEF